jgi:GNAT superfamily N-acetyltransferase
MTVIVRDYAEGDYGACRSLWTELTEYHRSIYGDPSIGGDDPGAGFDDYLAISQRTGSWVAESRGMVIGLTGLLDRGRSGEVEPVVVAEAARDQGVGRMLISRVAEEARARGYEQGNMPFLPVVTLAGRLGRDIAEFPGGHVGYAEHPGDFAAQLARLLGADR